MQNKKNIMSFTEQLKEGRIDISNHDSCTNHVGPICGDAAAFMTQNDPDMFNRIMDAAARNS